MANSILETNGKDKTSSVRMFLQNQPKKSISKSSISVKPLNMELNPWNSLRFTLAVHVSNLGIQFSHLKFLR